MERGDESTVSDFREGDCLEDKGMNVPIVNNYKNTGFSDHAYPVKRGRQVTINSDQIKCK